MDTAKLRDVENLVGEPKRERLDAIPSLKFKTNYAYFQIVMLAYNIWRYLKMIAQLGRGRKKAAGASPDKTSLRVFRQSAVPI